MPRKLLHCNVAPFVRLTPVNHCDALRRQNDYWLPRIFSTASADSERTASRDIGTDSVTRIMMGPPLASIWWIDPALDNNSQRLEITTTTRRFPMAE
jgi:hypothetical protein